MGHGQGAAYTCFVVSLATALVMGTLYGFGAYQTDLKKSMQLTQQELELMGVCMHVGLYLFKPLAGIFYDRFGPRLSVFAGGILGASGYLLVGSVCWEKHSTGSLFVALLGFMLVGCGSAVGYICVLSTNSHNFAKKYRGRVVGTLSSCFGLSATVVSLTYIHALSAPTSAVNTKPLVFFFVMMAVLLGAVCALGTVFVRFVVVDVAREDVQQKDAEDDRQRLAVDQQNSSSNSQSKWPHQRVTITTAISHLFTDRHFLFLCAIFFVGCGCGLFVINNVGSMRLSLAGSVNVPAVQSLVIVLAIASCAGRLLVGWSSDMLPLPRKHFLIFSLLTLSLTLALSSAIPNHSPELLTLTVIGTGIGYGGIWTVVPTMLSEVYGLANFGKVYGVVCMAPAFASLTFNQLASVVYDAHTEEGTHDCFGAECFAWSLGGAAIAAFVAAVATLWLHLPHQGSHEIQSIELN